MTFITRLQRRIMAKTSYLEEKLEEISDKLKKFRKAKPSMLKNIEARKELKATDKSKESAKLDSVERFLTQGIADIKSAIKWRDAHPDDVKNKRDLPLDLGGCKLKNKKADPNFREKDGEYQQQSFNIIPGHTCPYKKECFGWCYAMGGRGGMPGNRNAVARALGLAERDDFVPRMVEEMKKHPSNQPFRLHVTGDFYNADYVNKWIAIIKKCPERKFYAYTKSHQLPEIKALEKLPNMTVRYSFGGQDDDKIDIEKHPHSKVFDTEEDLKAAGYTECKNDDRIAADKNLKKMGIVKHGTRKYDPKTFRPSTHAATSEIPVAHLFDQIDAPHHWSDDEKAEYEGLDAHMTSGEWTQHWS